MAQVLILFSRNYSSSFRSSRPVNVSQLIFHLIKNLVISSLSVKSQWFPNPSHNTHSFSRCGSCPPVQLSMPATSPGHVSVSFPSLQCPSRHHPADACLLFTFRDTWTLFSKAFCSLPASSTARPSLPSCLLLEVLVHVSAINLGTQVPPISRPWKAHSRPYSPVSSAPSTVPSIWKALKCLLEEWHWLSTSSCESKSLNCTISPTEISQKKRKEYWFYFIKVELENSVGSKQAL